MNETQKETAAVIDVSAQEVLGSAYSSSLGYRTILAEVEPAQSGGGQGCGV